MERPTDAEGTARADATAATAAETTSQAAKVHKHTGTHACILLCDRHTCHAHTCIHGHTPSLLSHVRTLYLLSHVHVYCINARMHTCTNMERGTESFWKRDVSLYARILHSSMILILTFMCLLLKTVLNCLVGTLSIDLSGLRPLLAPQE